MKRIVMLGMLLLATTATLFAAQFYRWVDEKGNVEWRDTPPPPNAKKVEQRNIRVNTIQTSELPYSVQQAVKNFPVTLWLTDCGDLCDKARAHLNRRGMPYTERNGQSEIEAFKKASGDGMEVPLLFVGNKRLKGYLESDWDAALDTAGYPKTAVAPLKPQPKAAASPQPAAATDLPVRLYTNSQCGPQCAQAKELLGSRGIKFQEIAVEDPARIEEVKKVSGDTILPVLVVGSLFLRGFDSLGYNQLLDLAGFRRDQQASPQ